MRTLAEDTSPEMEAVLIGLLRKRTPEQKLRSMAGLRDLSTRLILSNLRSQHPAATERELQYQRNVRRLGREMSDKIFFAREKARRLEVDMLTNELQIIVLVAKRLEELRIPYFISGGIASIIHGEERLTKDADIVIRILPFHIQRFVQAFENDFVVSAEAVQDALHRRYAFNIIHIESAFKIDFYPVTDDDEMEMSAFARRQAQDIGAGMVWMASAEDVVLAKLHWFRKGGEVSEKQWRDVLGGVESARQENRFYLPRSKRGTFRTGGFVATRARRGGRNLKPLARLLRVANYSMWLFQKETSSSRRVPLCGTTKRSAHFKRLLR